jgi:hypothetical protein
MSRRVRWEMNEGFQRGDEAVQLTSEDRCHLNGLCVIDDEPRYVTALGETDAPGGWRENKASGRGGS